MKLTPLRGKILIQVDPEDRMVGGGLFLAPDNKSIKFCRRCLRLMEDVDDKVPCVGEDDWTIDPLHDRYVLRGTDYSHDVDHVTAPLVVEAVRRATVLAVGAGVRGVEAGDRVLIPFLAGGVDEDVRVVRDNTVLAHIEGE